MIIRNDFVRVQITSNRHTDTEVICFQSSAYDPKSPDWKTILNHSGDKHNWTKNEFRVTHLIQS